MLARIVRIIWLSSLMVFVMGVAWLMFKPVDATATGTNQSALGIEFGRGVNTPQAEKMATAGARQARMYLSWAELQPTTGTPVFPTGAGNTYGDHIIDDLRTLDSKNIDVILSFRNVPSWARSSCINDECNTRIEPAYIYSFTVFVNGTLDWLIREGVPLPKYVEILNEPDRVKSFGQLTPRPGVPPQTATVLAATATASANGPKVYADMVCQTWKALNHRVPLLMGGLAFDFKGSDDWDYDFLEKTLSATITPVTGISQPIDCYDAFNIHHYPENTSEHKPTNYPAPQSLQTAVTKYRDILAEFNPQQGVDYRDKPLLLTESGIGSFMVCDPNYNPCPAGTPTVGITGPNKQAGYVGKLFAMSSALGLETSEWAHFQDGKENFDGTKSFYQSYGLVTYATAIATTVTGSNTPTATPRATSTPYYKPAYTAFKTAAQFISPEVAADGGGQLPAGTMHVTGSGEGYIFGMQSSLYEYVIVAWNKTRFTSATVSVPYSVGIGPLYSEVTGIYSVNGTVLCSSSGIPVSCGTFGNDVTWTLPNDGTPIYVRITLHSP